MYNVYESKKVEHFQGMHTLENYIIGCTLSDNDTGSSYLFHSSRELHTFLTLSLVKLYSLNYKWDKLLCLDKIHIIGLPDFKSSKNNLILFIEIKDSTHGFVISHLPLNKILPNLVELTNFINNNPNENFKLLASTYDFVDDFYRESLSTVKTVEYNGNNEPIIKSILPSKVTDINQNKFDKSQYARI